MQAYETWPGVLLGAILTSLVMGFACSELRDETIVDACGPCDRVAECGVFVCAAGKDGWRKKP